MPNDNTQNQDGLEPNNQPVFGTPVAQFTPGPATSLNVNKPKKSRKKLFAILGAIGVVVLVAGGTITYLLLNKTSEPAPNTDTAVLPALGDALKSSLEDPANASVLIYKSNNPATVIQKVQGNVWISADDDSTVLSFNSGRDNQASNESDYNRVIKRLGVEGLAEVKSLGDVSAGYDATKATTRYFLSDKLTCVLRNRPENGVYALQVDCADQADFSNNKTAVKPFADAYSVNKDNNKKDILLVKPDIQNSVTKDYKTARLTEYRLGYFGDNSSAVFYQTPDGKWNFFTSAKEQDKINCDDYDSTDIVNAYLGFTCWDSSKSSSAFVQKDDPTFEIVPGSAG